MYQVTEIQPPQTPTFEQIRAQVEEQFKDARPGAAGAEDPGTRRPRHAEHDLKKAAKELGATVKTSDLVDPNAQVPEIGRMSGPPRCLHHEAGRNQRPIQGGSNGSCLARGKAGALAGRSEAEWDQAKETLLQEKGAPKTRGCTCRTCVIGWRSKARSRSTSRKWSG